MKWSTNISPLFFLLSNCSWPHLLDWILFLTITILSTFAICYISLLLLAGGFCGVNIYRWFNVFSSQTITNCYPLLQLVIHVYYSSLVASVVYISIDGLMCFFSRISFLKCAILFLSIQTTRPPTLHKFLYAFKL